MDQNEIPQGKMPMQQDYKDSVRTGKRMPIAIIILFILVLLSTGALLVINYFPEVVFSPKNIYVLSEKQAIASFQKQVDEYMNDAFIKDRMNTLKMPYTEDTEIKPDINIDNLNLSAMFPYDNNTEKYKRIIKAISSLMLKANISCDYKNEKIVGYYAVNVQGNELLKTEFFSDKKKVGIKVPALFDKYITLDGDDLTPIFEKYDKNSTVKIKKLITNSDILKAIKFDKKEAYGLMNDYSKYFVSIIGNKNFSFKKGVELITKEGKTINGNSAAVKLTGDEIKDIMVKMLERASTDNDLLNLTAGNVMNIMKLYEEAGYYGKTGLPDEFKDMNKVKENLKNVIEEIKKDTSNNGKNAEFTMTLLIDRKFNVIERKIKIINKKTEKNPEQGVEFRFAGYIEPDSKSKTNIFEINAIQDKKMNMFELNAVESPKVQNGSKVTNIVMDMKNYQGDSAVKCIINTKDNTVKDKSRDIDSTYEVVASVSPGNQVKVISGNYNVDKKRDPSAKTMDLTYDFKGKIDIPQVAFMDFGEFTFGFNVKDNYKFGIPVKLPKLEKSNTVDLNTAMADEIKQLGAEIETSWKKFYAENQQIFADWGIPPTPITPTPITPTPITPTPITPTPITPNIITPY